MPSRLPFISRQLARRNWRDLHRLITTQNGNARREPLRTRSLEIEALEVRTVLSASGLSQWDDVTGAAPPTMANGHHAHAQEHAAFTYAPRQYRLTDTIDGFIGGPAKGDPLDIAYDFLTSHAQQLGIGPADVRSSQVTDQYVSSHTGTTHIYLNQTLHGLSVVNATININVAADGRVINVGSSFLPEIASQPSFAGSATMLAASEALSSAAKHLGLRAGEAATYVVPTVSSAAGGTLLANASYSQDHIPAHLFYAPTPEGSVVLAWNMVLRTPEGDHWYDVGVDAYNGRLVHATDWIDHASYNVYPLPVEAPHDGQRSVVVDPADPTASPFGWHDTNGVAGADTTNTTGNNVSAQEDRDNNNSGGFRPSGGASLDFDFPLDLNQEPANYESAAITNLFYWNNALHDVHYLYGFDEPSGNFQLNNYGNGGAGGDPVQADAQDGSGTDNANFGTPPDGQDPRMQMYIWTSTSPNRDSDLDNQIIVHEYGHGVSNRLTGGPSNAGALGALQSGGMGEGWSDWWGLMFTQKPRDTMMGSFGVGTYVLGQPTSGLGIRQFPYSFDTSINPQSYGRVVGNFSVHSIGEIWASALWDLNWLLIDKYGYEPDLSTGYTGPGSAGNLLALQLVMDGLKLQPALPTLLNARDAILAADQMLTGGENDEEIWTAFARRGMGLSADDGGDANSDQVVEAFDLPIFGLTVLSTDPALESASDGLPVDFTLDFSDPFIPATVDATDFSVNGLPADSFIILDEDSVTFHFDVTPVTVEGPQVMEIAEGVMTRATDLELGLAWQGVFYFDLLPMAVTGTSPAEGETLESRPTEIVVQFNEALAAESLDIGDLQLNAGEVTAVELLDADSVRFMVDGVNGKGVVSYVLPAGAVTDAHGTPGPEYAGSFTVDDPYITRYRTRDVGKPINGLEITSSRLNVNDVARITDLEVELDVTHAFVGSLDASLVAPDGTRVVLFAFVGGTGSDFSETVLDDDAPLSISEGRAPFTGRFRPQEPLSVFHGMNAMGAWRLEITSFVGFDLGTLNSFRLVVTRDPRLLVVDSTPPEGARLDTMPQDFSVRFSEAYDPETVDLGDFTVNGSTPDAVNATADDAVMLHFNSSPVSAEGPQTIQIDEGVLSTLATGLPNAPWQSVFYYDLLAMDVVATFPAEGATVIGVTEIVIDLNEEFVAETVGVDDLRLSRGEVTAAEVIDADTVRYLIDGASGNGLFTYELQAGAVTDLHGSPNPAYVGSAIVDNPFIQTHASRHVPQPIRDFETTVSRLSVSQEKIIADLEVELDITHTFDGDLDATLVAPDGTRVVLFQFVGGGGEDFTDTVFDDQASLPIAQGSPPFTGTFRPQEPLAAYNGMQAQGTWQLEIHDFAGADEGSLNRWALVLTEDRRVAIVESSPADGQSVGDPPVDFAIRFAADVDPTSVDAADLRVNGLPADRFTLVGADQVTFHFDASPATGQGPQTMAIAASAVRTAAEGLPNFPWQAVFFYDAAPMEVVTTTPSEGATVMATQTEIAIRFNEPVDEGTVDVSDLLLSRGSVVAADVLRGSTIRFMVEGMDGEGEFTFELPEGAINDAHGNPGPAYIGRFTVDDPLAVRYAAQDVPLPIPDRRTTVSRLIVDATFTIDDVNVELDVVHPNVADLIVRLTGPDGTTVVLFMSIGGDGDDFTGTVLDDEANVAIGDAAAPFTGRFRPEELLSAFDGLDALGEWQLSITDRAAPDTGTLTGWTLALTTAPPAEVPGDTNGDGAVDVDDLNNVRNNFGARGHRVLGDTFPFNGIVDVDDLNAVRNHFGSGVPAGALSSDLPTPALPIVATPWEFTSRDAEPIAHEASRGARIRLAGGTGGSRDAADMVDRDNLRLPDDSALVGTRHGRLRHASRGHHTSDVAADVWDRAIETLWAPDDPSPRRWS